MRVCECGEREREREMEVNQTSQEEEAILSKYRMTEQSGQSPISKHHLWVFWSQEEADHLASTNLLLTIQNQIKTVLCSLRASVYISCLVQFWAPTTTMMGDNQSLLTTTHQPFAFKRINEDLIRYRKHSLGQTFVVADGDGDGDGIIGRVFKNQLPEFSEDVGYYSLKEHPQRELALSCGITRSWAFPVFDYSQLSKSCVGVLEFLFSSAMLELHSSYFAQNLQWAGLATTFTREIWEQMPECIAHGADEIKEPLRQLCISYNLPLAYVLARSRQITSWNHDGGTSFDYNLGGRGDLVVSSPMVFTYDLCISPSTDTVIPSLLLRVGQGLIGNAFWSNKPFLCRDVTQLSMSQYPLAHTAQKSGLTGCLTICLQSIATANRDYVLIFYLSRDMAYSERLHNLLFSMVVTLNYSLQSFEVVAVDMGDEIFIEVDKFSIDSVFESLKPWPTIIYEVEPGAYHNEGEILHEFFPDNHLAMEEFANSEGIRGNFVGLEQDGEAIALESIFPEKKSSHTLEKKRLEKKSKAHKQKGSSCSYETLKYQFGKKLEDAAESLGVSRSTVKRWCRENNIERWPFPKRSKITSLPPIRKQVNEPIQGNESISDSSGKALSCSDVPASLASNRTVNTVTVKATYKNDIIKFQLSFSSGMNDLVEKVILRLKLNEGTFAIKYRDDEGDYILLACDEDLQECINSFRRISEETEIKMLIEPSQ